MPWWRRKPKNQIIITTGPDETKWLRVDYKVYSYDNVTPKQKQTLTNNIGTVFEIAFKNMIEVMNADANVVKEGDT